MLYVGNQAKETILKKLDAYNYKQQIETQGVKTLSELQACMEGNVKKAVVIWNLQKLQKQYLPALFILINKYKNLFTQTVFFLHSEVFLPFNINAREFTIYTHQELDKQLDRTILNLLKEKNLSSLENLALESSESSALLYINTLLETLFKSISKSNSNPVLINLFIIIHKLIAQINNNMLTAKQALTLAIDQLQDTDLI